MKEYDMITRVSGTIKALEWRDEPETSYAVGAGAEYLVELSHNGSWYWEDAGPFDTLEAAKAAAQADYESRILAAIEPDPEPQPVAWRYRSVVKPTCWSNVTEYRRTAYARIGMEEQPLYATTSSAGMVSVEALIDVLHCCDTEAAEIANRIAGRRGHPCRHPDGVQVLEDAETIIRAALRALAGDQP